MKVSLLLNKNNNLVNESYLDYFKISNIEISTELEKDSDYIFNISENIIINRENVINIVNDLETINIKENIILNNFDYNNPLIRWILPIKKMLTKIKKSEILKTLKSINIIYYNNNYSSISSLIEEVLIKYFENFNNINFYIINKKNNVIIDNNYDNIYINVYNDKKIEDLIINAHYVLIYNNNGDIEPIIISFNYGCQLIINKEDNIKYNYKSSIILEKKVKLESDISLDIIYNEINELLNHRNIKMDEIIKNKTEIIEYSEEILFHKICNKYKLKLPNIFIQTYILNINDIKTMNNNFRELYLINNVNKIDINLLVDEIKISIYDNEKYLKKILYNLNESILFNLTYCENLYKILNIISHRNFRDIMILNNTIDKELIKKNYNNFYYIYEYENLFILITL